MSLSLKSAGGYTNLYDFLKSHTSVVYFTTLIGFTSVAFLLLTLTPTITPTPASATSPSGLNIGISEVLSLSIEAYDDTTSSYTDNPNLSMTIIPGQFKTSSAKITVDTNAPYGYHLMLDNKDGNNALVELGDNPSSPTSPYISSITTNTTIDDTTDSTKLFDINKWGYAISSTTLSSTTPTIPLSYSSVPTTNTTIATTNTLGANAYDFTTGTRVDATLPAGIYKDELVFSIIANAAPNAPSFYTTYYMQDFTNTTCNTVKTPTSDITEVTDKYGSNYHDNGTNATIVPSTTLIDKRDGQEYTIRKLADGNCWMTDNLRLGKLGAVALDSTNSNLTSGRTFNLPVATTQAGTSWANQQEFAFVYYRDSNPGAVSPTPGVTAGDGPSGLYNWYTATAGARDSSGNSLMTASSGQAADSICPKGWQLPVSEAGSGTGKSYSHLVRTYTGNGNNRSTTTTDNPTLATAIQADIDKLLTGPTSFIYSDYYYYGGTLYSRPIGYYWSSSVNSATYSRDLYLNSDGTTRNLSPQYGGSKGYAFAVRCVVQ